MNGTRINWEDVSVKLVICHKATISETNVIKKNCPISELLRKKISQFLLKKLASLLTLRLFNVYCYRKLNHIQLKQK